MASRAATAEQEVVTVGLPAPQGWMMKGVQIKRRKVHTPAHEKSALLLPSERNNAGDIDGLQKTEPSKVPKYINTRVDEIYQARKSSERCKTLFGNDRSKVKSAATNSTHNDVVDTITADAHASEAKLPIRCSMEPIKVPSKSKPVDKDVPKHEFQNIGSCSQNVLRNVSEIHVGRETSECVEIDMDKALKSMAFPVPPRVSRSLKDSLDKYTEDPLIASRNFHSVFHLSGNKSPIDFTLKTNFRLVSSSSVKWFHRINANPGNIINCLWSSPSYSKDDNLISSSSQSSSAESLYSKALCSWAYPQTSFPPFIISAMTSSSVREEAAFFKKRQQDWEDSFQNLYYLLRKNLCNIFYVYTSEFVALFTCGKFGQKKHSCNAYLSRSTLGLRSLLKKHDIHFTMPLCHAEVEHAAEDDYLELSEIKRRNLGQALRSDSTFDIDNSPQSLLSFIGNGDAHGLYDFLLNYRSLLNSLSRFDVPVLYSPVPFQNAALLIPKVTCKEMRRADMLLSSSALKPRDAATTYLSSRSVCNSIEIKDAILPPWILSRICSAMSANGEGFEASYTTDPLSNGLNIALDAWKVDELPIEGNTLSSADVLGIPEATISPLMRTASLSFLKYSNNDQEVSVTPV